MLLRQEPHHMLNMLCTLDACRPHNRSVCADLQSGRWQHWVSTICLLHMQHVPVFGLLEDERSDACHIDAANSKYIITVYFRLDGGIKCEVQQQLLPQTVCSLPDCLKH